MSGYELITSNRHCQWTYKKKCTPG